MEIDRLVGILSILLQRDIVTAPELAEQFEVTRRTINRDIEDLCKAGIPIVTKQGHDGGISIMEGYKTGNALLTNTEMQDILAGLRSLDSVNGTKRYARLMEKLSAGSSCFMDCGQPVLIDLSSWYRGSVVPKIDMIHNAVENNMEIGFWYYSPNGEGYREIEPYYLVFCWSSWYVWGWCKKREDFRLFKLNRTSRMHFNGKYFKKRECVMPDLGNNKVFPGGIFVKAVFEPECKWRLVEEFGPDCYTEQEDGKLLFQAEYTNKENLITWILGFGDKAELAEPIEIRKEIIQIIANMKNIYAS